MQFRLSTLFLATAVIAVCFHLLVEYRDKAFGLLLGHLPFWVAGAYFVHGRRRRSALLCAAAYLGIWTMTATIGGAAVEADAVSKISGGNGTRVDFRSKKLLPNESRET